MHILKCKNCQQSFVSVRDDRDYCSRKCYFEHIRGKPKDFKKVEHVKTKPLKSARDIANEAAKAGMSYGEYVRKMGL